jgi:hypothetical protein
LNAKNKCNWPKRAEKPILVKKTHGKNLINTAF